MGGNLVMLPPPADLKWDVYYSINRVYDNDCSFLHGGMSWKMKGPAKKGRGYRLRLMSEDGKELYLTGGGARADFVNVSRRVDGEFLFSGKELETGRYYFAVQAAGDNAATADSEWAASEVWSYEQPEIRLPPVQADWNDDASISAVLMESVSPQSIPYFQCFLVRIYFEKTPGQAECLLETPLDKVHSSSRPVRIEVPQLRRVPPHLAGLKFFFKICAVSNDITSCRNGPLTPLTGGRVFR